LIIYTVFLQCDTVLA